MPLTVTDINLTEEQYIAYELTSEEKHEYINGKLITMPGEKDLNNEIALNITFLLRKLLKRKGFNIYMEGIKVRLPDEARYYYPDVFATKEISNENNQYVKQEPEIICEVLSDATRKYDLVDKFIAYQKIPSLTYYIVVEPQKVLVQLFYKENDEWEMISFTNRNDIIDLRALEITCSVKDMYETE